VGGRVVYSAPFVRLVNRPRRGGKEGRRGKALISVLCSYRFFPFSSVPCLDFERRERTLEKKGGERRKRGGEKRALLQTSRCKDVNRFFS